MLGFSGSSMGIGIAVVLEDRFSSTARKVALSMKAMRSEQERLVRQAITEYRDRAAAGAASAGIISTGLLQATKAGASFEQVIQKASIVADGALKRSKLRELSLQYADAFRMDPKEIGMALFENVKAGVTTNIDVITKYQLAVAKAVDETLEGQDGVAKGLLNISNAMGIAYKDFPKVANAVTVAANQSQASVLSLNESMQYTANTASKAGWSLQETLAGLAMLSQMGIEGSAAGTALSNLIRYSTKAGGQFATKRQIAALGMAGLTPSDLRDSQGNVLHMIPLMDKIAKGLKDKPTGSQLDILEALLGVRGEKAGINLLGKDGRGVSASNFLEQINKGIGNDIANKQAKMMMDTLEGDYQQITVKWKQLLIQFTNAVEPLLRKLLPMVSRAIGGLTSFLSTGPGKLLAKFVLVASPVIASLLAFRAAVLTATLALGGTTTTRGFGNLVMAGLGMAGIKTRMGSGLVKNNAGRWTVAAGRTFDYAGKVYKGGQLLPLAATAGMGAGWLSRLLGPGTGAAAGAARATGLLGTIAAGGSRVLGFLGGPWGMAIMAGMTILPMIYDVLSEKDPKRENPMEYGYLPRGFKGMLPGYDRRRVDNLNLLGMKDVASQELKQKIEIYVNGQRTQDTLNQIIANENEILNQFNIDI